jgi:mannose-6-phosphate isomerase-like protein (cupin superfamily)
VAPDHRHQRLRQQGFEPVNYTGDAPCASLAGGDPLPANEHFQAERIVVAAGAALAPANDPLHERIVYVVEGAAAVRIGPLAGELATNRYAHIPAATPHVISNPGPDALVLLSLVVTAS